MKSLSLHVLFAFVLVVVILLAGSEIIKNIDTANITEVADQDKEDDIALEDIVFEESVSIEWEARVITCLSGCDGYAFEKIDPDDEHIYFQAYMPEFSTKSYDLSDGDEVVVKGRWLGISCGYAMTIFDGKCTPDVIIENIDPLN